MSNEQDELPEGWEWMSLESLAKIELGITFPASAKQDSPSKHVIACLRTANIQQEVDWDDLIFGNRSGHSLAHVNHPYW